LISGAVSHISRQNSADVQLVDVGIGAVHPGVGDSGVQRLLQLNLQVVVLLHAVAILIPAGNLHHVVGNAVLELSDGDLILVQDVLIGRNASGGGISVHVYSVVHVAVDHVLHRQVLVIGILGHDDLQGVNNVVLVDVLEGGIFASQSEGVDGIL